MALIQRKPAQTGYLHLVGPEDSDLAYIQFGLLNLSEDQSWEHTFAGRETVLVILGGRCDAEADGNTWANIGQRADVFAGRATAIYLPPDRTVKLVGRGDVEIAVCSAPAEKGAETTLIAPSEVTSAERGADNFARRVDDIVTQKVAAHRILVGETYNPPGLWSSYPPHKHDVHSPPDQYKLEEVYHFRLKPQQGFGIQRVYGDQLDESYAVKTGDTVAISTGFHPVVAAPGYELYYLWILAGEERILKPSEDPAHAWVGRR